MLRALFRGTVVRGLVVGLLLLLGVLVAIPVNVVTGYLPAAVTDHHWLWIGLLVGGAALMVLLNWLSGWYSDRRSQVDLTLAPSRRGWVNRGELDVAVSLLAGRRIRTAPGGTIVALIGAGGFGKTTLAEMVRSDRRVRKRFPGGSLRLVVGQGVRAAALATKLNDVVELLGHDRPGYADPAIAGKHLIGLLNSGPRRLLIVDDVWSVEQLDPFENVGARCCLLVTTRVPDILPRAAHRVPVDRLSPGQARQMLTSEGLTLSRSAVDDLVRVTGLWPLLLSIVAGRLRTVAAGDGDVNAAARQAAEKIVSYGPAALDLTNADDRTRAVSLNIRLSVDLLPAGGAERFAELGIVAAETPVPVALIAKLWAGTAGLDESESFALCQGLGQLSLVRYHQDTDTIELHDIIRAYLRAALGSRLSAIHSTLVAAIAASLSSTGESAEVAWWELPADQTYLWDHLAEHLAGAGSTDEFDSAVGDLRWIGARLIRSGPAGAVADLSHGKTARSGALGRELMRIEHLLAPTVPSRSVVDVLLSRLRDDSTWRDEVERFVAAFTVPYLISRWPLPDVPDEPLRRTLKGHEWVTSIVISADGTWLASGSLDGTIGIWDVATGRRRATLAGHAGGVRALALSPDETWLAAADGRGDVALWELASERIRLRLSGVRNKGPLSTGATALVVSSDGTCLTLAGDIIKQWDVATGRPRESRPGELSLTNQTLARDVAISPDGNWLASAHWGGGNVDIWDASTGERRNALKTGHADEIECVAISPDGLWLATGGRRDRYVKLWDASSHTLLREAATEHAGVSSIVIAADGTWFATVGTEYNRRGKFDSTVQLWDVATGRHLRTLGGDSLKVQSVAISPDGCWLAAGDRDGSVRIWDLIDAAGANRIYGGGLSWPVAVSSDSTWVAATSDKQRRLHIVDIRSGLGRHDFKLSEGSVQGLAAFPNDQRLAVLEFDETSIVDCKTGQLGVVLTSDHSSMREIAISPTGELLATAHSDGTVLVWDATTGVPGAKMAVRGDNAEPSPVGEWITSISIAPGNTWLATTVHLDSCVRIWDARTGAHARTMDCDHPVEVVRIAPDGTWLTVGAWDGMAYIWDVGGALRHALDVSDGKTTGHQSGPWNAVKRVAISPHGNWLATAVNDESTVRIWDPVIGRRCATLAGQAGAAVKAVDISADGAWLAVTAGGPVGTDTHTLAIWCTSTWECVASTRVNGRLEYLYWTADGHHLVLTGAFGVYVFDFNSGCGLRGVVDSCP